MKKDKEITEVVFRKWRPAIAKKFYGADIIALFPYEIESIKGEVNSYEHVGQHSGADYQSCIQRTTPATPEEYAELKAELESLGYNLKVVKRRNYESFFRA